MEVWIRYSTLADNQLGFLTLQNIFPFFADLRFKFNVLTQHKLIPLRSSATVYMNKAENTIFNEALFKKSSSLQNELKETEHLWW